MLSATDVVRESARDVVSRAPLQRESRHRVCSRCGRLAAEASDGKLATATDVPWPTLLRFDVRGSTLPETVKARLLAHSDRRITAEGVVIIKAQRYRSLDQNRADALARLQRLVDGATVAPRPRKATKPTAGSQRRRVDSKVRRGEIKAARRRIVDD